ncbi:hypothetical protein PAMC26577_29905 [Caballeronia sordidicola]|uniref:Uncharacterized protein n=1 Tax=Caballeronia sordidicola TaxID=196367 RepID=A0A242MF67_CABSO|nr:hypothetical protein PAMC26577_29905 [Caballeronia sordidicola]
MKGGRSGLRALHGCSGKEASKARDVNTRPPRGHDPRPVAQEHSPHGIACQKASRTGHFFTHRNDSDANDLGQSPDECDTLTVLPA